MWTSHLIDFLIFQAWMKMKTREGRLQPHPDLRWWKKVSDTDQTGSVTAPKYSFDFNLQSQPEKVLIVPSFFWDRCSSHFSILIQEFKLKLISLVDYQVMVQIHKKFSYKILPRQILNLSWFIFYFRCMSSRRRSTVIHFKQKFRSFKGKNFSGVK